MIALSHGEGLQPVGGFRAAGVACGIKASGAKDLALIVADKPCPAAGTFTTNAFAAAPVQLSRAHVADGQARAIVANSGNANAATGTEGRANARRMAELAAQAIGCPPSEVLVCSTGRIGAQLPMDKIAAGIRAAASALRPDGWVDAAEAIRTTDKRAKHASAQMAIGGASGVVQGIAKGAGMISPCMATMLCFVATDVAVGSEALRKALRHAVVRSFNRVTVDSDTSTNDTVIALASGELGNDPIRIGRSGYRQLRAGLADVCLDLARQMTRDGEGASKVAEVRVSGARSRRDAERVARAVADSPLVKTAMAGSDWNWGRVAAAVGKAGVKLDPNRVTIAVGGVIGFERGEPVPADPAIARAGLERSEVLIEVDLGAGKASATVWGSDLTPEYVRFNAEYTT